MISAQLWRSNLGDLYLSTTSPARCLLHHQFPIKSKEEPEYRWQTNEKNKASQKEQRKTRYVIANLLQIIRKLFFYKV